MLLPRRTHENRKTLRGVKAIKAKDRITANLFSNADGSDKVPVPIIGTAKNPKAFRIGKCPIPYFNNKTAWYDGVIFRKWLLFMLLPHVRASTTDKISLVVDKASSHSTYSSENTTITSVHKPMDIGITAACKRGYLKHMFREIVVHIESRAKRRQANQLLRACMKGIREGYDPRMVDVANMAKIPRKMCQNLHLLTVGSNVRFFLLFKTPSSIDRKVA